MKLTENIKWMYGATKGVRGYICLFILFGVLSIAASLFFIWLVKGIIDVATNGGDKSAINLYIWSLAGMILLRHLITVARLWIGNYASTLIMNRQRIALFDTVMRSEWRGKELRHTGDVVSRIEGDSRTIGEALGVTIPSIIVTLVQFVAAFRFLQILDARLSWIIVAIMPLSLVMSKRYMFKMRELTQVIRTTDSSLQSHLQEQIQNRTIINTVGDTSASVSTLERWSTTLLGQTMHRLNYTLFSRTIVQIGFGVGYLVALSWGVYGLQSGAVTFGMLTAFLQLVSQVQAPSVELAGQISTAAKSTASAERLQEIGAMRGEDRSQDIVLTGQVGLKASGLGFAYPDSCERQILSDFNFDFRPNSLHAIVGHTGVGKSTLIRLMLGLLKPDSGTLELYNHGGDSARCSAATRHNFIYVPQGNTLMSGTVRENLLLAKPQATEQELLEALHTAVADFILELPQGLDTLCGERGTGLSEGEAQRIAIARGLLQSGNIMLLDEPTSALDAATEELLISRLAKYATSRTLIMVTHRNTAAQLCASTVKLGE